MFYNVEIIGPQGPLGFIFHASSPKYHLNDREVENFDVDRAVQVLCSNFPFSLRIYGDFIAGLARIFHRRSLILNHQVYTIIRPFKAERIAQIVKRKRKINQKDFNDKKPRLVQFRDDTIIQSIEDVSGLSNIQDDNDDQLAVTSQDYNLDLNSFGESSMSDIPDIRFQQDEGDILDVSPESSKNFDQTSVSFGSLKDFDDLDNIDFNDDYNGEVIDIGREHDRTFHDPSLLENEDMDFGNLSDAPLSIVESGRYSPTLSDRKKTLKLVLPDIEPPKRKPRRRRPKPVILDAKTKIDIDKFRNQMMLDMPDISEYRAKEYQTVSVNDLFEEPIKNFSKKLQDLFLNNLRTTKLTQKDIREIELEEEREAERDHDVENEMVFDDGNNDSDVHFIFDDPTVLDHRKDDDDSPPELDDYRWDNVNDSIQILGDNRQDNLNDSIEEFDNNRQYDSNDSIQILDDIPRNIDNDSNPEFDYNWNENNNMNDISIEEIEINRFKKDETHSRILDNEDASFFLKSFAEDDEVLDIFFDNLITQDFNIEDVLELFIFFLDNDLYTLEQIESFTVFNPILITKNF